MNTPQQRREGSVSFIGEQDGAPERDLKKRLSDELDRFAAVRKAYLAQVRYGDSGDVAIGLCVFGALESAEIVDACARQFQAVFGPTQFLDVLFITAEQECRLGKVCQPFFEK